MIDNLEKRFGRFAIPNLTMILIVGQVLMYTVAQTDAQLLERIALIPSMVFQGEVYRLVTFMLSPPGSSPIWAFFFWYLFYLMGTALEHFWGTFRYNVYLLIGYLATVGVSFLSPDVAVYNGFLHGSVFLAFAYLNPGFVLHIFFVLPIPIRWLALLTWIGFGYAFVIGSWSTRLSIAASVLNFFVFFGRDIVNRARLGQRHMLGQARRFADKPPAYFHKCVVCGLTDTADPRMDFRYCGKCSGDMCYCTEHLRDHDHVNDDSDEQPTGSA